MEACGSWCGWRCELPILQRSWCERGALAFGEIVSFIMYFVEANLKGNLLVSTLHDFACHVFFHIKGLFFHCFTVSWIRMMIWQYWFDDFNFADVLPFVYVVLELIYITEPNILEQIGMEDFWHIHDLVELFVWNRSSRWNPTWIFWKPHQLQQINHRSSCKYNKEKLGMRNPHEQWKNPPCFEGIILPSYI